VGGLESSFNGRGHAKISRSKEMDTCMHESEGTHLQRYSARLVPRRVGSTLSLVIRQALLSKLTGRVYVAPPSLRESWLSPLPLLPRRAALPLLAPYPGRVQPRRNGRTDGTGRQARDRVDLPPSLHYRWLAGWLAAFVGPSGIASVFGSLSLLSLARNPSHTQTLTFVSSSPFRRQPPFIPFRHHPHHSSHSISQLFQRISHLIHKYSRSARDTRTLHLAVPPYCTADTGAI
jgi:hypothetical protein